MFPCESDSASEEHVPRDLKTTKTPLEEILHRRRDEILSLAARRGAFNVRVFGSAARGEADPRSGVDFLVELEPGRSLLDLGGRLMDLQGLVGCKVGVVTERGRLWDIRVRVL